MSVIDNKGKEIIEPGEFLVSVGGKQTRPSPASADVKH
jgi:hypothetical protein